MLILTDLEFLGPVGVQYGRKGAAKGSYCKQHACRQSGDIQQSQLSPAHSTHIIDFSAFEGVFNKFLLAPAAIESLIAGNEDQMAMIWC